MNEKRIYIRDAEGYVKSISSEEMKPEYTQITREEWEEESGVKFYNEKFGHGGKRTGAGRKLKTGNILKFQIRVSEKEKKFINYAREHKLDYDSLMQG